MPRLVVIGGAVALVAATVLIGAAFIGASGSGSGSERRSEKGCPDAYKGEWQELANRLEAPVYCPGWVPAGLPITAHHASIGADGSYQVGFHDPEVRFGDIHAVVARYPDGSFPRCTDLETGKKAPCATEPTKRKHVEWLGDVTLYEQTWGHEANHFLYAWKDGRSLYTVSVHKDRTLTREHQLRQLERVLASLERIEPNGEAGHQTTSHHDD